MEQGRLNWVANFIWGIADDVLRDLYVRGKYRDVILPMSLPIYLERVGLDTAKEGIAVIAVHGKGNLAKWRRLFTAYDIPCYVIFDNDGEADDKKGVKRRDALHAVSITKKEDQDSWLGTEEVFIGESVAVFGSNFEIGLRSVFADYENIEDEGRKNGVDSKPFLARYVAENLKVDKADGWKKMKKLVQALRDLM